MRDSSRIDVRRALSMYIGIGKAVIGSCDVKKPGTLPCLCPRCCRFAEMHEYLWSEGSIVLNVLRRLQEL